MIKAGYDDKNKTFNNITKIVPEIQKNEENDYQYVIEFINIINKKDENDSMVTNKEYCDSVVELNDFINTVINTIFLANSIKIDDYIDLYFLLRNQLLKRKIYSIKFNNELTYYNEEEYAFYVKTCCENNYDKYLDLDYFTLTLCWRKICDGDFICSVELLTDSLVIKNNKINFDHLPRTFNYEKASDVVSMESLRDYTFYTYDFMIERILLADSVTNYIINLLYSGFFTLERYISIQTLILCSRPNFFIFGSEKLCKNVKHEFQSEVDLNTNDLIIFSREGKYIDSLKIDWEHCKVQVLKD
jgi:hypothetical protein